jgi:hypothetical protein
MGTASLEKLFIVLPQSEPVADMIAQAEMKRGKFLFSHLSNWVPILAGKFS